MTQLLTSRRAKRAANVLGIVLLIAVVAPFAVFAVPEVVGADESFVVLTASMTPAIAPGDVVIVAERDPTAIAEGDVITFVRGTSDVPVTHRVIGVSGEGAALAFETMGDANEGPDPGLVPAGNIVGVVALTIPWIGYVIQFAGTRVGFVALVMLPFGLLAATEVWSIVRGRSESEGRTPTTAEPVGESDDDTGAESVGPEPATESDAAPTADAAGGSGGVSVDAVGGAAAVLAAVTPYAIYVAFELRTAVAIAVAVAAATLLLGALAAWIPASGVLDRSGSGAASAETDAPAPTADGGVSETDGGADAAATDAGEADVDAIDDPDRGIPATTPAPADGAAEADR
ncbi:signal peptidase I [Halorubrum sp. ASP1]|uniref:signal peptidase I n=1 Tax=Halorubrum sp. ASP1 TaxID=2518114 RepID=UPI0010F65376|nr:signal peptidase I [Halorubrum sp. ASP1]TKX62731.1 signal peptidase I [Halorubrum sp. ASP1]